MNCATRELRKFGLVVGGIVSVIGLYPVIIRSEGPRVWALVLGGMLIILGLMVPQSLKHIHYGWMKLSHVLGTINTRIILGIVYYGLVTPMGIVMRLLGKDAMRRLFVHDATTYRIDRGARPRDHMRHQF